MLPSRAELMRLPRRRLCRPGPYNPDTYLVSWRGQRIVVKDCRARPWLPRLLLRWLLRREARAYGWMPAGLAPPWLGFVDREAIALGFVPGRPISQLPPTLAPLAVRRLEEALARLHAAGLFHLDLRSGGNILVDTDGGLRLLDFASMVRLAPWLRPLYPLLAAWDRHGLRKWRQRAAGAVPPVSSAAGRPTPRRRTDRSRSIRR